MRVVAENYEQTYTHIQTYTHTHTRTRDNYSNPRCAHARQGLNNNTQIAAIAPSPLTMHPQLWVELLTFEPTNAQHDL